MERICTSLELKLDDSSGGNSAYRVSGYASVFNNVDQGKDVMLPGAFASSLSTMASKNVPLLFGHRAHDCPIGKVVSAREDAKGLWFEATLPRDDNEVSSRIIPQVKHGSLTGVSIGYKTTEYEEDNGIRNLKEVELWEISLVTFPMNPQAQIEAVKSIGFDDLDGLTDREREQKFIGMGFSRKLAQTMTAALRDEGGKGLRDAGVNGDGLQSQLRALINDIKQTTGA